MNENALAQQCPKFHIAGCDLPSGTFASGTRLRWWVLCLAETRWKQIEEQRMIFRQQPRPEEQA